MSQPTPSKKYLSQVNLIYFAQASMMLAFAAVVFALVYSGKIVPTPDENLTNNLTYALAAVALAGYAAAFFTYRQMLSRIDKTAEFKKKMSSFLSALLVRSACLEVPALLAAIVMFMTAKLYLMAIPVVTFIVFYLIRPTVSSIAEDMQLSQKEKASLEDPNW